MTVNSLGTDSRLGGDAFAAGSSRRSWLDNRWPLLAICIALFSISALVYYHVNRSLILGGGGPTGLLPRLYAGIYDFAGFAPSVLLCLLVASWGGIWLVTGTLDRRLARFGRLLMMTALLGVFLNLGDGGVTAAPHKGAFGAWLAGRLVGAIGYVPTLVLVWPATFAALILATDWFFSENFERLRRAAAPEMGVEQAVTDHLRGLSTVVSLPTSASPSVPLRRGTSRIAPPAVTLRSSLAASTAAAMGESADAIEVDAGVVGSDVTPAQEIDVDTDFDSGDADEEPRLGYAERRAARQARRDAAAEAMRKMGSEGEPASPADPAASVAHGESQAAGSDADHRAVAGGEAIDERGISDEEAFAIMASLDAPPEVEPWQDEPAAPEAEAPESHPAEASEANVVDARDRAFAVDEDEDVVAATEPSEHDDAPDSAGDTLKAWSLPAPPANSAHRTFEAEVAEAEGESASEDAHEEALGEAHEDAADLAIDGEPEVAIPRPESPMQPSLPTPPVARQQQLFGGADEALVQEAIELVVSSRRATAGLLQRKLRVDYELACALLRELASRGFIALEGDASRGRVVDA